VVCIPGFAVLFYVSLHWLYHVAATDMNALRKKQTRLQAVTYLGFTAPGAYSV